QLDPFHPQAIAAPVRRSRHSATGRARSDPKTRRDFVHALAEHVARGERPALFAGPRGNPAFEGATGEILVALAVRRARDRTFDAHLAMQRVPMEYGGGARACGE